MLSKRLTPTSRDARHTHQANRFPALSHWIQQLPIWVWAVYLVILGLLIVVFNALAWFAGLVPVGTFDLYRSSIPCYPIGSMMLMVYLNRVARRALANFRPALAISNRDYSDLEHQLTTMPRRGIQITLLLSFGLVAVYLANTPYILILIQQSPLIAMIEGAFYTFAFALMGVYFYHTLWQLWMVNRIHAMLTDIDLFNRAPLYAFSRLSSRTGISLLLMNFFGIVTDPATFSNVALINVTVMAFVLAVLSFLLPLQGISRRIIAEKRRLLQAINQHFGALVHEMYAADDSLATNDAPQNAQLLHSVATTRSIVESIPTLPWERGTLIGFALAFLLTFMGRVLIAVIASLFI